MIVSLILLKTASGSIQHAFSFSGGPGGFGELREAGRNHFHLSWYLLVPGITSYGPKPWERQGTLGLVGSL